ncbi:MAG: hypothetical protein BRC33_01565 [Cyanobacteria bacterium SW_9_44_58]|nr:MAG: hypothetical protein BRC33_01565 [Cyanobacteria bacterium SW_9_44_58]
MPKKESIDHSNFFQDLALSIKGESSSRKHDIISFLEEEVDNEAWGIELCRGQLIPLKVLYGVELDLKDREILEEWKQYDRTTWDPLDTAGEHQGMILESGRRSGKSLVAAVIIVFEFYKLVMRKNPQAWYGVAANSPISLIAMATTADQTQKTIFNQIRNLVPLVRPLKRMAERGDIDINKKQVACEEKMIYIYPGHSESSGQVGQNVICLVMDEVARFPTDPEGNSYAETIWSNIGLAGMTFGNDAKRIALSSAWEPGDAIENLYENVAKPEKEYIGFRLRSFDMNPKKASRDNPVVKSEYSLNPLKAALEFEGKRLTPQNRFMNSTAVVQAFSGRSKIRYRDEPADDGLVRKTLLSAEPADYFSVGHIDPAIVGCRYGFAFGHTERDKEGKRLVVIDGMMAWQPYASNEVSITNVQQVILDIHEKRPFIKLTSDHHQQAETIQRMRARGINAQGLTFSNKHQLNIYEQLRYLLNEGRVVLPKDSPIKELVKDELNQLELANGNRIEPPSHGSKDIADSIASVAWYLTGDEVVDDKPKVISSSRKVQPEDQDPRSLPPPQEEPSFPNRGSMRRKYFKQRRKPRRYSFGEDPY